MKILLTVLLLGGFILNGFAQNKNFKNELYIGVKGGESFSSIRFYPFVETNYLSGNTGGIVLRMISEPHIGFQIEVNYIQKGWKEKPFTGQYANVFYFHHLNYIDVPIMTHINIGKKAFRFTINLGPEFGFLSSEKEVFGTSSVIPSDTPGYQQYYGQKIDTPIDILFTGGIGTELHFRGGNAISLEGRVFYSLPNVYDSKKYMYKASQANGAQVTLAYLFRMGKK
jgi:hypothetical protein